MGLSITVNGVAYPVPSSAADTNWAAQQVAFLQAVAAALAPPTWLAPALINGWANIGAGVPTVGYYKDSAGTVHLRGSLHFGASATVAFVLPAGYLPPGTAQLVSWAVSGVANITITSNGNVTITNLTAGANVNSAVALDGLSFSTIA